MQSPQPKEAGLEPPGLAALPPEARLVLLPIWQQCQVTGLYPKIHPLMVEKPKPTGPLMPLGQQQRSKESQDSLSSLTQLESLRLRLQAPLSSLGLTPRGFSGHVHSFLCTPPAPGPMWQGATSGRPALRTDCTVGPLPPARSSERRPLGRATPPPLGQFGFPTIFISPWKGNSVVQVSKD